MCNSVETHVRVPVSVLALNIYIAGDSKRTPHFLGIVNLKRWLKELQEKGTWRKFFGPFGGSASLKASPSLDKLRLPGVSLFDPKSPDLCLKVPLVHFTRTVNELSPLVRARAELERELREELTGHELARINPHPILTEEQVRRIVVLPPEPSRRYVQTADNSNGPVTKRILIFCDLVVPPDVFAKMVAHPLIKEFSAEDLPTIAEFLAGKSVEQDLGNGMFQLPHLVRP